MESREVKAKCPECGSHFHDLSGLHGHIRMQHSDLSQEERDALYEEAKSQYIEEREKARESAVVATEEEPNEANGIEDSGLRARVDEIEEEMKDLDARTQGAGRAPSVPSGSDSRSELGEAIDQYRKECGRLQALKEVDAGKHKGGKEIVHIQVLRVEEAEDALRDALGEYDEWEEPYHVMEASYRGKSRDDVGEDDPFGAQSE